VEAVEIGETVVFLPATVADLLRKRLEPGVVEDSEVSDLDPEPAAEARADLPSPLTLDLEQIRDPINIEALASLMSGALDEYADRLERNVQALFDLHTGKV
jgi:hypothetical protein